MVVSNDCGPHWQKHARGFAELYFGIRFCKWETIGHSEGNEMNEIFPWNSESWLI